MVRRERKRRGHGPRSRILLSSLHGWSQSFARGVLSLAARRPRTGRPGRLKVWRAGRCLMFCLPPGHNCARPSRSYENTDPTLHCRRCCPYLGHARSGQRGDSQLHLDGRELTFDSPEEGTPPTTTAGSSSYYYASQPFYLSAGVSFTLSTTAAALTFALDQRAVCRRRQWWQSAFFHHLHPLFRRAILRGVFTTYAPNSAGSITGSFNAGLAVVTLGSVPEPSTWVLLGLSAAGIGVVASRQRRACKLIRNRGGQSAV